MIRHGMVAAVLAVLLACPPFAAHAGAPRAKRLLAPADIFALRRAADARISPDGRQIAYVRATTDRAIDGERNDVMIVSVANRRERLIARSATTPRWSPDGRTLAYVADGTRVVLQPIDGGKPARFDVPGGIATLVWSPDGHRLAYTAFVAEPAAVYTPPVAKPPDATWAAPPRIIDAAPYQQDGQHGFDPGHLQLFVIAADGSGHRQLTSAATDVDGDPAWTHDGDALVYSAQPVAFRQHSYTKARLFRIGIAGSAPVPISPAAIGARAPAISPDGRTIAFLGARATGRDYEPSTIYVMDADGANMRALPPSADEALGPPTFSPDGRAILTVLPDQGTTVLMRMELGGTAHDIVRSVGGDAGFTVSGNGVVAFLTGSFDHPADIAVVAPGGRIRPLTALNDTLLGDRQLATIRPFPFHSNLDGANVGAWLVCPPATGCRNLPLVLMIHGGPYGYDDPTWNAEDQLLAAADYGVLHVNYRGSLGYGFPFADRIAREFPEPSYIDLMSGVDAAVTAGFADPNRLFVAGGSAGGQLAAWTVGRTRRFKAAAVVKPVINEISDALLTDQFANLGDAVGALPWDQPLAYWHRSPLSLVGQVTTPTLLMVGDEDHRTPISEAQQFFDALQWRGVPSRLVVFPGAGHASILGTPSRLIAGVTLQLEWFARYGGPVVTTSAR